MIPKTWFYLISVLLLAIYIIIVVYTAAQGPSGKQDDYWYLNDLQTFMQTGRMQSNQIFPVMLLNQTAKPHQVLHNLPLMYAVIPFTKMFGIYWGWTIANLVYNLLTLCILLLLLRKLAANHVQMMCFIAMYLFWIITVHTASHALAEAGVLFYITLLTLVYTYMSGRLLEYVLLGIITSIIVLNRTSYLALVVLLTLSFIFLGDRDKKSWMGISIFLLVFGLLTWAGHILMPMVRLGILSPLKMPDKQAMLHFYTLHPVRFLLPVFIRKVQAAFLLQLTGRFAVHFVFVTLFNLLAGWFLFFHIGNMKDHVAKYRRLVMMYLLVYLATLIWFQYQTRFLQMVMPFLLVWFVLSIPQVRFPRLAYLFVAGFCVINFCGDIYYSRQNHLDARLSRRIEAAYQVINATFHPIEPILATGNSMILPFVFQSAEQVLMCDEKINTKQELLWMHQQIGFKWILCERYSTVPASLASLHPRLVKVLPPPMSEFGFYCLEQEK